MKRLIILIILVAVGVFVYRNLLSDSQKELVNKAADSLEPMGEAVYSGTKNFVESAIDAAKGDSTKSKNQPESR